MAWELCSGPMGQSMRVNLRKEDKLAMGEKFSQTENTTWVISKTIKLMATECFKTWMVESTKVTGLMISNMGKAKRFGTTALKHTRGSLWTARKMGRESSRGVTVLITMVISLTGFSKESAHTTSKNPRRRSMGNFLMARSTVKAKWTGLMEENTGVSSKMARKKAKVPSSGPMETCTLENSKMGRWMDLLYTSTLRNKLKGTESGKTGREYNGLVVQRPSM